MRRGSVEHVPRSQRMAALHAPPARTRGIVPGTPETFALQPVPPAGRPDTARRPLARSHARHYASSGASCVSSRRGGYADALSGHAAGQVSAPDCDALINFDVGSVCPAATASEHRQSPPLGYSAIRLRSSQSASARLRLRLQLNAVAPLSRRRVRLDRPDSARGWGSDGPARRPDALWRRVRMVRRCSSCW
jgi:hypothetical protein